MRKRAVVASLMSSAAVLVFGWQLGTQVAGVSVPVATGGTSGTSTPHSTTPQATTPGTTPGATAPPAATTTPAPTTGPSGTYTGDLVSTRFGTVQVAATIADGQITDVIAVKLTDNDRRSVQISNQAAPMLRSAVLAAQSANIGVVSGATYTSDAYLSSLQSALDQAGL